MKIDVSTGRIAVSSFKQLEIVGSITREDAVTILNINHRDESHDLLKIVLPAPVNSIIRFNRQRENIAQD